LLESELQTVPLLCICGQEAAKRTAAWLVEKSLDRGSRDNITILIVDVRVASKTNRKGVCVCARYGVWWLS
jgi:serine/threonine protein phosphatase PrpC